MGRDLTPDELGAVGESHFQTLCARAQLVCNKSDRDRTGWDFVIEFPMPGLEPGVTLDNRVPLACNVQLKATTTSDAVKLRLSAADRLAKDLRPTFIVVLRLTAAGEPERGHLTDAEDGDLWGRPFEEVVAAVVKDLGLPVGWCAPLLAATVPPAPGGAGDRPITPGPKPPPAPPPDAGLLPPWLPASLVAEARATLELATGPP